MIKTLFPTRNQLGEAPIWCAQRQALFWLDILNRELFMAYHVDSNPILTIRFLPIMITAMDILDEDHLIMAGLGGVYQYHIEKQELSLLAAFEHEPAGNRPNDGKMDGYGRFWFGTMDHQEKQYSGRLYCYQQGKIHPFHDDIGICNGFGWSPDHKIMYNGDSMRQEIYRYDYDADTGHISNKRLFISLKGEDIYPDGLCVDEEGYIWSAQWNGYRIIRYDPNGNMAQNIAMPIACPSSCVIGGKDNDKLFITSARKAFDAKELLTQPEAGALFMLNIK